MNRKVKTIVSFLAILVFVFNALPGNCIVFATETDAVSDSGTVIDEMVEAVQLKDWDSYVDLMCSSQQQFYTNYFSNDEYVDGVKQIESVELVNKIRVDNSLVSGELLVDEYPVLNGNDNIYCYIVELDCTVSHENQYFYNGVNYFLIVVILENSEYKIVQFNRPSSEVLEIVMEPILDEENELYDEEKAGMDVIASADEGVAVNGKGELLTEGFEIMEMPSDDGISPIESRAFIYPVLERYTAYTYPGTIRVLMSETGNGQEIVTVGFDEYIRNTLPNEWYGSWHEESLEAGAYCVKMVGWYRKVRPLNSAAGYDISQGTQKYIPGTSQTGTNTAVVSIRGKGMANSEGKFFFSEYAAGTEGQEGTAACGQLKQWGSQYLANERGYTCTEILNYYYSGSVYSDGNLTFFNYK